mmetsp:Transcript_11196/g.46999  ORF Transcript_11196/g.46999 Transcript_11196/m.46999 type:complete len:661 (-) Transcript_11196:570-2552(-)
MMLRHISLFTSGADRPKGLRSISFGLGGSVASANAPSESMIMFTHSRGTAASGSSSMPAHAEMKLRLTATTFTTSWNCRNLRMLWKTLRPQSTALAIDWMLSSRMTMSHASLAISVPAMPSANPTSASFSAGASFVPSPVTDTTSPRDFCRLHSVSLSAGDERASTRILVATDSFSFWLILRNAGPSRTRPPSPSTRMPASLAIACAVKTLSPVTMRTTTPAPRSRRTASAVSGRMGSLIPTIPSRVRLSSGGSSGKALGDAFRSTYATHNVRKPVDAIAVMASFAAARSACLKSTTDPSVFIIFEHIFTTISDAPLQCSRVPLPPGFAIAVLMRFRAEVKWYRCATSCASRIPTYAKPSDAAMPPAPAARRSSTSCRSAHSVLEPMWSTTPFSESFARFASELTQQLSASIAANASEASRGGMASYCAPPNHPSVTVMRFCVSVPVLSALSCVALPMVSHASSRRTRFWSIIILRMANASPRVMARGRPSGMATTTMVTELIMNSRTFSPSQPLPSAPFAIQRIMDARNVKTAAPMPKFPTVTTKTSRRSCKGVLLGSTIRVFRITPHCERDPTHVTRNRPEPSEMDVPDNRNGSFSASLPMSMGSPVIAASFALNLLPSTKMPSAGTLSPATSSTRSPTSTSPAVTARATPPRTTFTA